MLNDRTTKSISKSDIIGGGSTADSFIFRPTRQTAVRRHSDAAFRSWSCTTSDTSSFSFARASARTFRPRAVMR